MLPKVSKKYQGLTIEQLIKKESELFGRAWKAANRLPSYRAFMVGLWYDAWRKRNLGI